MQVIKSATAKKELKALSDGNFTADLATGKYFGFGPIKFYVFTSAITANSTLTSAPAGTAFAMTSNATGAGSIYRSDGTKWQFLVNA